MDQQQRQALDALVDQVPEGWSRVRVSGQAWGVTRTTRANGKVVTISAERLSDAQQLSANVWVTTRGAVLKPCEVPAEAVVEFLQSAAPELSGDRDAARAGASVARTRRGSSAAEGVALVR
ncbi:hypothetical protein ACIG47_25830 [Promicromonospora sp. NPDC052451]|uniref:hypothetical protein n=1 Tax=Promicromonospora sp. NPDC052451 TaxID=3364407 RepID=UPI0037CB653D